MKQGEKIKKMAVGTAIVFIITQPSSMVVFARELPKENVKVLATKDISKYKEVNKSENKVTMKDAQIVNIPDPVLKALINAELKQSKDSQITKDQLASLEYININRVEELRNSNVEIRDLTGIENCTNVKNLVLGKINISDISRLQYLTKLEFLDLGWGHNISDISPLKNLNNLTYANLRGNNISNLTPIKNLNNLEELDVANNNISDISPLKNLKSLKQLYLDNNNVSDISQLNSLIEGLFLDENNISDISPLKNLKNLNKLAIRRNNISDISVLKSSTKLQFLWGDNNKIKDISVLGYLENLQDLSLKNNLINDITSLSKLSKLNYVELDSNNIMDLSPLKDKESIFITAKNQSILLSPIAWNENISIKNPIKLSNGAGVPIEISSNGKYNETDNTIRWNKLPKVNELTFKFNKGEFSGTIRQPLSNTVMTSSSTSNSLPQTGSQVDLLEVGVISTLLGLVLKNLKRL